MQILIKFQPNSYKILRIYLRSLFIPHVAKGRRKTEKLSTFLEISYPKATINPMQILIKFGLNPYKGLTTYVRFFIPQHYSKIDLYRMTVSIIIDNLAKNYRKSHTNLDKI